MNFQKWEVFLAHPVQQNHRLIVICEIDFFLRIFQQMFYEKSLDRVIFLYILIRAVRCSGIRASITIVHSQKFHKKYQNISRIGERSIVETQ